jgi:eukaryotic-like serine/threonine-protein kinase
VHELSDIGAAPGERLPKAFGQYVLLSKLAVGGMGELFTALLRHRGTATHELRVIKRLLPHLVDQPRFTAMFKNEARVATRIRHPNVCRNYELGCVDGQYYIAMEYLEGISFGRLISARNLDPRLSDLRFLGTFISQVCEGLHCAHELREDDGSLVGVVHRDICHSNIMVTSSGLAKVLDFGVAKAKGTLEKTRTGVVKGTYAYSSPEQLRSDKIDARSDIFSLGVITWEAFTGKRLFKRETDFLVFKAVIEEPIPLASEIRRGIPARVARVIARALDRDPDRRYPTARQFGAELLHSLAPLGPPPSQHTLASTLENAFHKELEKQRRQQYFDERDLPPLQEDEGDASTKIVARPAPLPLPAATDIEDDKTIQDDSMALISEAQTTLPQLQEPPSFVFATTEPSRSDLGMDGGRAAAAVFDAIPPTAQHGPVSQTEYVSHARFSPVVALTVAIAITLSAIGWVLWERAQRAEPGARAQTRNQAALPTPLPHPVAEAVPAPPPAAPSPARPAPAVTAPEPTPKPEPTRVRPKLAPAPSAPALVPPAADTAPAPRRTPRPPKSVLPSVAAEPGLLTIDASPYATIFIDGKEVGYTPLVRLSVPAGRHRVKAISSVDRSVRSFIVQVSSGEHVRKKIIW